MHSTRSAISALVILAILSLIYIHEQTVLMSDQAVSSIESSSDVVMPLEIHQGNTRDNKITFTFDGGEDNISAVAVLDILAKHHLKGTFFLTGQWVGRNRDLVARMRREGHEIYNHSFTHPHLTEESDEEIGRQLQLTDALIESITGSSTRPYFRPPYGDYDIRVLQVAARAGYQTILWSVDAGDWMERDGYTDHDVRERVLSGARPGAIILMHLGDNITGRVLDDLFTTLEGKGYELVPLSRLIRLNEMHSRFDKMPFVMKIGK